MAMGRRKKQRQQSLFVAATDLPRSVAHPFYAKLNEVLADYDLVSGKTIGVDATTLEANAAMRSIVRKDTKQNYQAFLTDLAKASGIETPTREDLVKLDKKRKNKASNDDWPSALRLDSTELIEVRLEEENPHDPDAKITRMKDGATHLAHGSAELAEVKQEHAVDMDSGAVLAVTIQPADEGDTTTWRPTIEETYQNLNAVKEDPRVCDRVHPDSVKEVVADKGYHSNETMTDFAELEIRTYVSEPDRPKRDWEDKQAERDAVYANRRRIRGNRGKQLISKRGELIERSFAHTLQTDGMRRVYLRGRINILKRMLTHVGGFNLSLVMHKLIGRGTPRGLQGAFSALFAPIYVLWEIALIAWRQWMQSARETERCYAFRCAV